MTLRPIHRPAHGLLLAAALCALPASAQEVGVDRDGDGDVDAVVLAPAVPAPAILGGLDTVVTTSPGIEIEIFGRAMIDQTFASSDEAGVDYNTSEARRIRLGVKGRVGERVKYKMELNTDSSGEFLAEDAYVQWYPTGGRWSVIAGQDNTHNSFHEISSSRFLPIAERAAFTDAFGFDRRLGVSLLNDGDDWTAAVGVHTVNLSNSGDEEGWAASARVTGTPIRNDDVLLHLGAHTRYRDQGADDALLRNRQRPLSHGLGRIVSTGRIADEDWLLGGEVYALFDDARLWVGTEAVVTQAESTRGGIAEDATFSGAMITAGTMLGGRRTYKNGVWKRPEVDRPVGSDGGLGALLLEARYDTLDLRDSPQSGGVDGGKLDTFAVAADWYATRYTHIGVTAFVGEADLGTQTSGLAPEFAALVAAGVEEETVSGIVVRAQFDFGTVTTKF